MKTISRTGLSGLLVAAALSLTSPATARPGSEPSHGQQFSGMASWYGPGFVGRRTASGEAFHPMDLTAAHPTLPFGTLVEVSRLDLGHSVIVRITDRGPYNGHVIDLSVGAARLLRMIYSGIAPVRVRVIGMTE